MTFEEELAGLNEEYFDKDPSDHLADWAELIQAASEEFQHRRTWMSNKWTNSSGSSNEQQGVRLLDYACGSGTVSKAAYANPPWALLPFVTQAVGLDVAPGMVAEYNKWAAGTGLSPDKVQAYEYNFLAEDSSSSSKAIILPENVSLSEFDIVIMSMALHHVADPAKLLNRLARCLRKGGVCVILDLVPNSTSLTTTTTPDAELELSSSQAEMLEAINKHGFSEDEMTRLFDEAGLGRDVDYVPIERQFKAKFMGAPLSITGFIARGGLV